MWAPLATLGHFVVSDMGGSFQYIDDGARTCELINLIGCAFITMLDVLDKDNQLKKDGEINDLGLIVSLYLKFAHGQEDYGTGEEDVEWRSYLVPYAKKAGYDQNGLQTAGCDGTGPRWSESDDEVSEADLNKAAKHFDWTKTVSLYHKLVLAHGLILLQLREYKKNYTGGNKLGGERYNIMKMSRKERASYAFDKKDPLAEFSEKDIMEGNLV